MTKDAYFSNGGCRKGVSPNAKNYDSYCGCCEANKSKLNVAGKSICADNCPSSLASMAMASANYCGAGGEATNSCLYKDGTGECEMMGCGLSDPNLSLIGNICQDGALNSDPNYCKGVSGCKIVSDPIKNACGGSVGSSRGPSCLLGGKIGGQEVYCCNKGGGESSPCNFDIEGPAAEMCEKAGNANDVPSCDSCDCGPGQAGKKEQRKQGGNFGQGSDNGKPPVKPPPKPLGPGGTPPVNVNTLSTWNKALGIGSVVVAVILFAILAGRGKKGLVGAVILLLVFIALGCLFFFNVIKINEKYGNLPAKCQDSDCSGKPRAALSSGTICRSSVVSTRSEERRVGKECRSRWSPYH